MNNPLVTIFCCFRAKKKANEIAIFRFLDSVQQYFPDRCAEVLLKIDEDDAIAINTILPELKKYPFVIKPLIFHRWEGRWSMNYFYDFMFTQRNPATKFTALAGDDMYYTRSIMNDLQKFIDNDYCILGYFKEELTAAKMNIIKDYRSPEWLESFYPNGYTCSYPIVSNKLMEVAGNFGVQTNVDSFFGLLNLVLFKNYKLLLAHRLDVMEIRDNISREDTYGVDFNQENIINARKIPAQDSYFYTLIERQAHNIYLNIKEEELLERYTI